MSTKNFYRDLLPLPSFHDATQSTNHSPLPDDWFVVLADVVSSTIAIEAGKYKDVNTVGAATIMAVLNVDRGIETPFVFGGDGATLAIPKELEKGTMEALLGAQEMAKQMFGLDLRVGMIPAQDIRSQGHTLNLAKYQHSKYLTQASLGGSGWSWADAIIKNPSKNQKYLVCKTPDIQPNADFTGFECRWKPINAVKDYKVCLIIQITQKDNQSFYYEEILNSLEPIIGTSFDHHPLKPANLRLNKNPFNLKNEAKLRSMGKGPLTTAITASKLAIKAILGGIAISRNLKIKGISWGNYRDQMIDNADYRKFDGALKMVVDLSEQQVNQLVNMLEKKRSDGMLVYGIQKSPQAIMTCLVFSAEQNHAHFVDGSDGGYALAAKMLKNQIQSLNPK